MKKRDITQNVNKNKKDKKRKKEIEKERNRERKTRRDKEKEIEKRRGERVVNTINNEYNGCKNSNDKNQGPCPLGLQCKK